MNKKELLEIFTREQRIDITYPGWRREETEDVIRHVSIAGDFGFLLYLKESGKPLEQIIEEQVRYFNGQGQPFEWKVYDYDKPSNLKETLVSYGFEINDPEALLIMDINESRDILERDINASITRIVDEQDVDDVIALEDEVWGISHSNLGERLKRDLRNDSENTFIYVAYDNGKAVSTSWMFLHPGTSFGSLWGGSTLPEYRGKGLYTSMIAVRARDAHKNGYPLLLVDAGPMSTPILQKRGFQLLAYSYPCMSPAHKGLQNL